MAQGLLAGKRVTSYLNLAGAALLVVTAVVYYLEATAAANFNATVVVALVGAAACAVAFALVPARVADLGNLAAVGLTAYALATFLVNSINALVDMLTGISMFSGGSDTGYIFTICGLMGVALLVEIASCFMSRDSR